MSNNISIMPYVIGKTIVKLKSDDPHLKPDDPLCPLIVPENFTWSIKKKDYGYTFIELDGHDSTENIYAIQLLNEMEFFYFISDTDYYEQNKNEIKKFAYDNWDIILKESPDWPGDAPIPPQQPEDPLNVNEWENYEKDMENYSKNEAIPYSNKLQTATKYFISKLILRIITLILH